ncbi:sugar phosphate isomerase/epimerase [bacterium]|nr:sugar phosphate isomerase/epimerase [bacterium]
MLGISTACMPGLSSNLDEFFKRSTGIGFGTFEIGVSSSRVSKKDILNCQRRLNLKVASVHNIFTDKPVDPENKRGDFLASADEKKREETIELTLETAKFAKSLGARVVVLHAGYIEDKDLKESYRDFKKRWSEGSTHLQVLREHLLEMRTRYAYEYVERVIRSLKTLCQRDRETLFCLEPRVNFYEIPSLKEMEGIFNRIKEYNLCYWHDTGHCQVQENMGLSRQEDWLKTFREKMVGIHLHDVRCLEDHLLPGLGDMDFSLVRKYLSKKTIKIVEVGGNVSGEDLKESLNFLKRTGID